MLPPNNPFQWKFIPLPGQLSVQINSHWARCIAQFTFEGRVALLAVRRRRVARDAPRILRSEQAGKSVQRQIFFLAFGQYALTFCCPKYCPAAKSLQTISRKRSKLYEIMVDTLGFEPRTR
jgi:hypothetical protein